MKGGQRENAGRPKGSRNKVCVADLLSVSQKKEITDIYFETAKTQPKVLVHLIDQIYGKAQQAIDHTTLGEAMNGVVILPSKNESTYRRPLDAPTKTK